jgi:transposase
MRFVELKSEDQLDMQILHRTRDRLVAERTALINQFRSILLERGLVFPQGRRKAQIELGRLLARETVPLSPKIVSLLGDLRAEWEDLDRRISAFEAEFVVHARADEAASLLTTIPGIGPINATALRAAIGNAEAFARARDLAAWLCLRPLAPFGRPRRLPDWPG